MRTSGHPTPLGGTQQRGTAWQDLEGSESTPRHLFSEAAGGSVPARGLMAEPWQGQCGLLEDKLEWRLSEIGHLFLHTERCCPLRKCQSLCFRKEASVEPGASLPVLQSWLCPLPRCVTFNEVLRLSVPQLPHLQNDDLKKKKR